MAVLMTGRICTNSNHRVPNQFRKVPSVLYEVLPCRTLRVFAMNCSNAEISAFDLYDVCYILSLILHYRKTTELYTSTAGY